MPDLAMTTFSHDGLPSAPSLPHRLRRHGFLALSLATHAALFAALSTTHRLEAERNRQRQERQSLDAGERLTAQVRLDKRVHDMARIKSLLEQSAATGAGRPLPPTPPGGGDVQFSGRPAAPDALLDQARDLSRAIDAIARDTKAEDLAKLLGIPKAQALQRLPAAPTPAPMPAPRTPAQAAAQIERLEAGAREVLAQRRRRLAQLQDGTRVTAGVARNGGAKGGAKGGAEGDAKDGAAAHAADVAQDAAAGRGAPAPGTQGGVALSAMLARIDGFTHPDLPDRATAAYADWNARDVFKRGDGRIPDVGAAKIVKGSGRIIGPGGTYANRVYVNRWYLIGPFDGRHGKGLLANDRHPPEQGVALDAVYRGKQGRLLRWAYVDMDRYPLIPPDEAEDAVYYGYTEVMVDRDEDLTAWIGADDDAQLWLNDRLVWAGGSIDKGWFFGRIYETYDDDVRNYNLSEGKRTVHFRKGRNKLFFKLSNGPTRLFFSLVLTK